jgi:hypothetical protein
MATSVRPTGPEGREALRAASAVESDRWYFDGFYEHLFYRGRVELRYKELLRLKLSFIQGCFT